MHPRFDRAAALGFDLAPARGTAAMTARTRAGARVWTLAPAGAWAGVAVCVIGTAATTINAALLSPLIPPIADRFHVSVAAAGQLGTLTATFGAIVALLVAPTLDRAPRRTWLRLECAILVVATTLTALAPSFAWLFAARALAGIGGAFIFGVCLATVGDLLPDGERRNRAVGLVASAATLGAGLGLPVITQIEASAGWRWAAAAPLPLLALFFLGTAWLPAVAPSSERRSWRNGRRAALASRAAIRVQLGNIATAAVWFAWMLYLGAYARDGLHVGPGRLSLLFAASGAGELLGNNLAPLALSRRPALRVGATAALLLAASLAGVATATAWTWLLFPCVLLASGAAAAIFTVLGILVLDVDSAARGAGAALFSAGFEIGGLLGMGGAGAVLALSGSYPLVYALLGAIPLVALAAWTRDARQAA
jgi:DHA1 family inner membrane transport protein